MSMTKPFATFKSIQDRKEAAPHPNKGFLTINPNAADHLLILGYVAN